MKKSKQQAASRQRPATVLYYISINETLGSKEVTEELRERRDEEEKK